MRFPIPKPTHHSLATDDPFQPTPARLTSCISTLASFLSIFTTASPPIALSHFTTPDWGRLILAVVLSTRLSFPIPLHNHTSSSAGSARDTLHLVEFLDVMTKDVDMDVGPADGNVDVAAASGVVMAVVKEKYEKRLAALLREEEREGQADGERDEAGKKVSKCPMLDGSLDAYFPLWEGMGPPLEVPPLSFLEGMDWPDDGMSWMDEDI